MVYDRADWHYGGDFPEGLIEQCDEKFWEEDLNDEGNRFPAAYYESGYVTDYSACFHGAHPSLYHVDDSPSNQLEVEGILDRRLAVWRQKSSAKKPWWRVW